MQQCQRPKQWRKGESKSLKKIFSKIECYTLPTYVELIFRFRVSISPDPTDPKAKKLNISNESKTIDIEEEMPAAAGNTTPLPPHRDSSSQPERTRLIVFGVAKIQKTRLLATLSGLKVKI